MQVLKFKGFLSFKKWLGPKSCKIWWYFGHHQTMTQISLKCIEKPKITKKIFFTAIPPAFGDKSPVNFGPLTKSFGCEFGHTQVDFFENHILALTVL